MHSSFRTGNDSFIRKSSVRLFNRGWLHRGCDEGFDSSDVDSLHLHFLVFQENTNMSC